jgi:hypothetical protein
MPLAIIVISYMTEQSSLELITIWILCDTTFILSVFNCILKIYFQRYTNCFYYFLLFTGITCTRGSLNLNEHIDIMKDAHSYDFQEYVTMSCKRGFTGTNVSAQCIDVDKWSQPSPICKGKGCIVEMHKHRWGN